MNQENNKQNDEVIDLSDFQSDSSRGPNKPQPSTHSYSSSTPKITQWLIKCSGGYINEKQANYILIVFIIIAIITSLLLIFNSNEKQETFTPDAEAPAEDVIPPEF